MNLINRILSDSVMKVVIISVIIVIVVGIIIDLYLISTVVTPWY